MHTVQRAARPSDQRTRRTMRPPLREGKFLKLTHMSFGMNPDPESGQLTYTGRVGLGVLPVEWEARASERTTAGTVTAIDLAMRAALARMRQEVPVIRLWPYHIRLTSRTRGTSSSVSAEAKIALNGWQARQRVRHADGVTAAAFLLFDAYDHLLYERWQKCLSKANVTPEEAFRAMMGDAVQGEGDASEAHA